MHCLFNHQFLLIFVLLSFAATVCTYVIPFFTSDNLVISEKINPGTFLGTFVHLSWGHFIGNVILLIPSWIFLDNKLGKAFVLIIVILNMLATGIYGFLSESNLCGASGIVYMLLGLCGIAGNWLVFFICGAMFISEFTLLDDKDNTAHGAHITFFIVGVLIGVVRAIIISLTQVKLA